MKASDFLAMNMNPAVAYLTGLCVPLYKEKKIENRFFVIGAVNHNANMITEEEIAHHFMSVSSLFNDNMIDADDVLVYNQSPIYGTIQPKKGFSVLLEKDVDILSRINDLLRRIVNSTEDVKVHFVKGCFDGRSSFDTSRHFLAIDVDRDHQRQFLIRDIIASLDISVNLNQREFDYKKNDQIRIQPNNLSKYMRKIGFFSERRRTIIKSYLNSL